MEFTHNFMLVESYSGEIKGTKEATELRWMTFEELNKEKLELFVRRLVDRLHDMGCLVQM